MLKTFQETTRATVWQNTPFRVCILAFLLFLACNIGLQSIGNNYSAEFGGHPDEAAHYVTALMIRDYIAQGFPGSPMAFAKDYYDHYPKVALGNWPPLFYVVQTAWTLVIPPGQTSIMLLMACLSAALATILFVFLRSLINTWCAVGGSLIFLCLPVVQEHTSMVMTEILVGIFVLLATIAFAAFMDRATWLRAVLFALAATGAIMTKGSALSLALLPPVSIFFARRFDLLKRPQLWGAAGCVAVLCAPWYILSLKLATRGWDEQSPSIDFFTKAFTYNATKLVSVSGVALVVLALTGIVSTFALNRKKENHPIWHAMAALIIVVPLFHCIIPAGTEPRHLVPVMPAVILFSLAGLQFVANQIAKRFKTSTAFAYGIPAALAVLLFFAFTFEVYKKGFFGFDQAVLLLQGENHDPAKPILVSSDARGEGMFISQFATRENRPGHTIRRASKLLASSNWRGRNYEMKAENARELIEVIVNEKIAYVVVDESVDYRREAHHTLLEKVAEGHPDKFRHLQSLPVNRITPRGDLIHVYKVLGYDHQ